jgi:hypothetical protein
MAAFPIVGNGEIDPRLNDEVYPGSDGPFKGAGDGNGENMLCVHLQHYDIDARNSDLGVVWSKKLHPVSQVKTDRTFKEA